MSAPERPRPRERAHGVERRARKVLERDYERLRATTCSAVERKLSRLGARVDPADIDPAYNLAWQALYAKLAAGEQVENPAGFLTQATFFRVVDEHRGRRGDRREDVDPATLAAPHRDIEDRLDDERRLRELAEGMRARLGERERRAAVLCYLHGYSRDEAADVLGIRASRMQKVMDRASKVVRSVVEEVGGGEWCASQRSLVTAYALGVLEQGGPRHALAREHLRECPGCRARVLALRGLGAAVPPIVLPWAAVGLQATQVPVVLGGASAVGGAALAGGAAAGTGSVAAGGSAAVGGGGTTGFGGVVAGIGAQAGLAVGVVVTVATVATAAVVLPGGREREASAAPTTTSAPSASAPAAPNRAAPLRGSGARRTLRALRSTARSTGAALQAGGAELRAVAEPGVPTTVAEAPAGESATAGAATDPDDQNGPSTSTGPEPPTTTERPTTPERPASPDETTDPAPAAPTTGPVAEPTPPAAPTPAPATPTSTGPALPSVTVTPGGIRVDVPIPGQGTGTITLGGPSGIAIQIPSLGGIPGISLP